MAAAAKAVELGYGVEPDPGRSGRLGSFAISGIPKEACAVHATRSAQIDTAVGPRCLVPSPVDGRSYHPGQKGARNGRRPFAPLAG